MRLLLLLFLLTFTSSIEEATRYTNTCHRLLTGRSRPIRVVVASPSSIHFASDPLLQAHAVRIDDTCVIYIREKWLSDTKVLTHETCHCAHDFDLLAHNGYRQGVTLEDARVMESAAVACASNHLTAHSLR